MISAVSKAWRLSKNRSKNLIRSFIVFVLRRYFLSDVEKLLLCDNALESKRGKFLPLLSYSLANANNPVAALNYCSDVIKVSDSVLWNILTDLQGARSSAYYRLMNEAEAVGSVGIKLQLLIKRYLLNPSSKEECLLAVYNIYKDRQGVTALSFVRGALATLVLEKAPVQDIKIWLEKFDIAVDGITDSQRLRFLSRLALGGNKDQFRCWEKKLSPKLFASNKLKFSLISFWARNEVGAFTKLESMFINEDIWLSRQYLISIKPHFDQVLIKNNFLDARFSSARLEQLKCLILGKIIDQVGFAYIRLGDGESYGFGENKYIDCAGLLRQELHWWGTELDEGLRHELQSKFLAALPRADILGVPTVLRLIRDFNPTRQDAYERNSLISRLLSVMEGAAPFMSSRLLVEDQSNLYLFDNDFIGNVVRLAKKVYVVSGVNSELVEAWNPDASKVEHIEIPTHRLLKIGNVGTDVSGIFPHVYQEYIDSLGRLAGPGVVFLFSAGFIGKILIAEVAQKGAVGLDIGQYLLAAATEKVS